jgi:hypothetical protein
MDEVDPFDPVTRFVIIGCNSTWYETVEVVGPPFRVAL